MATQFRKWRSRISRLLHFRKKVKNVEQTFTWQSKVHIVTWNVGSKQPENLSVDELLGFDQNIDSDQHWPDIFVIGLQEVKNQLFKDNPWSQCFLDALSLRNYVAIISEHMQGLLIVVFVRRPHLLHVSEVETGFARTGLGTIWVVCISMIGSTIFGKLSTKTSSTPKQRRLFSNTNQTSTILHFSYVFWFGDLNFRLTGDDKPETIKSMIEDNRLDELIKRDELSLIRRQRRAFAELNEQLPQFPPTFKFKTGTSDYNLKRRPAWCDRILYKAVQAAGKRHMNLSIEQITYRSHPSYTMSDHKPVTAEFAINVCENSSERIIEFTPIHSLRIGEEVVVDYEVPHDFVESKLDWIGIYRENFTNLNDYITYESCAGREPPDGLYSAANRKYYYQLVFPDSIALKEGERYQLLYFHRTSSCNFDSLVGISEPFIAKGMLEK